MDVDREYSPPPPAYSEEDFDRKVAHVTELSLRTAPMVIEQHGWQHHESSVLESNSSINSRNHPSIPSSQFPPSPLNDHISAAHVKSSVRPLPPITPLRIKNKSSTTFDQEFPPDKKQVTVHEIHPITNHGSNSSPGPPSSYASHFPGHSSSPHAPSFRPRTRSTVKPFNTNNGEIEEDFDPYRDFPVSSTAQFDPHSTLQSLSVGARSRSQPEHRFAPTNAHRPDYTSPSILHIDFDPAIAYGNSLSARPGRKLPAPLSEDNIGLNVPHDPKSFYNSVVAAQLTPINTTQLRHAPRPVQPNRLEQQPLLLGNDARSPSRLSVSSDSTGMRSSWSQPLVPLRAASSMSNYPNHTMSQLSQYSNNTSPSQNVPFDTHRSWYPNS